MFHPFRYNFHMWRNKRVCPKCGDEIKNFELLKLKETVDRDALGEFVRLKKLVDEDFMIGDFRYRRRFNPGNIRVTYYECKCLGCGNQFELSALVKRRR